MKTKDSLKNLRHENNKGRAWAAFIVETVLYRALDIAKQRFTKKENRLNNSKNLSVNLNIRVTPEMFDILKRDSKNEERTISAVARRFMQNGIAVQEKVDQVGGSE
ncbi:hypothetical protein [Sulfitobacter sp. M22]|uniref:hypothetical protein n=1 Tax=Sulfitobacter sp. M22 TaxID=2675332 RepID=UPI001F2EF910|nr:hypothetical protein [Sulfitobacter sp. M22]MCF7728686.1 hypothetical protein [Sulfitobacter sp. M22]